MHCLFVVAGAEAYDCTNFCFITQANDLVNVLMNVSVSVQKLSVEICEILYPWRFERKCFRANIETSSAESCRTNIRR